ncbi:hypothetical protein EXN22_06165 [Pseudomonas tructae]|uniref:Uncharacterized protein n=1 Tax=Pseudomonas tructae TaxID=2518644 RepID=A0A411MER5_9PSED|nr:hypothetical protein [Pseudomonas tructae]QBF25291.1 hypothetical protein EXN22_06165 [Pseudomonas tructae]
MDMIVGVGGESAANIGNFRLHGGSCVRAISTLPFKFFSALTAGSPHTFLRTNFANSASSAAAISDCRS